MNNKVWKYCKLVFRLITKPKTVKIDNVVVTTKRLNFQMKKLIYAESWEIEERNLLKKYKPKINNLLEFGTCIGFLSIFVEKNLKIKNVTSIDANPDLIPIINENIILNNSKLKFINAVVGELPEYSFYVCDNFISSSLSKKVNSITKEVKGISFKSLTNTYQPDFIIIDIEGAEYDLINDNSMPNYINGLLIEFHGIKHNSTKTNKYINAIQYLKDQDFILIEKKNRVHYFERVSTNL